MSVGSIDYRSQSTSIKTRRHTGHGRSVPFRVSGRAISESTNRCDRFRISKEALALLSDFDYAGTYSATPEFGLGVNYVGDKESISI